MARVTAEERALARAAAYRLLSAAFSYPDAAGTSSLLAALDIMTAAGPILGLEPEVERLAAALAEAERGELEAAYQRAFTLSYSADCPMYETAFSARHLFQQTSHLADLNGFYRAFGVVEAGNRSDHIAAELEFCYLLALKEAAARAGDDGERVAVARAAQRSFLRDHLARWAPLFAGRAKLAAAGTPYAAAARLLAAFLAAEERYLRLGKVARFRDEPMQPVDEPGEMSCPLADEAVESILGRLQGKELDHASTP